MPNTTKAKVAIQAIILVRRLATQHLSTGLARGAHSHNGPIATAPSKQHNIGGDCHGCGRIDLIHRKRAKPPQSGAVAADQAIDWTIAEKDWRQRYTCGQPVGSLMQSCGRKRNAIAPSSLSKQLGYSSRPRCRQREIRISAHCKTPVPAPRQKSLAQP